MKNLLVLMSLLLSFSLLANNPHKMAKNSAKGKREVTLVTYEQGGVKQWFPGFVALKKGEKVKLKLINKATGDHGFHVKPFKIVTVVKKGETKTVEFSADQAGLFDFKCHMHAAHVGGQFLVLE